MISARPAMNGARPAASTARRTPALRRTDAMTLGALLAITLAGGLLRLAGLPAIDGTMSRDATRLGLAARGILEHGLPILPSGFVYTRGLLPAYLEAASFALFGVSDLAARLPSLIFGTLLAPAVFLLGRDIGGRPVGLAAAAIVAVSTTLIPLARLAWLYSPFLVWLVMALVWLPRNSVRARALAGLATAAALLSHEFAIVLLPAAALHDVLRFGPALRRPAAPGTPRLLLAYWPTALAAAALVGGLSLLLRTPTAGGTTSELREYLQPGLDLPGLLASLRTLSSWSPWLLPTSLLGLPLRRLARNRATLLYLTFGVLVAVDLLLLGDRGSLRYLFMAVPLLAVAGPYGLARVARALPIDRANRAARLAALAGPLLLLGALNVNLPRLNEDRRSGALRESWLMAMPERRPDDLVLSYASTITGYYLGRTDFWLRPRGYEKYVWAGPSPPRDIHTNAVLIRDARELDELVVRPNPGRTLWALLDDGAPSGDPPTRQVYAALAAKATSERRTEDGHRVLRVQL